MHSKRHSSGKDVDSWVHPTRIGAISYPFCRLTKFPEHKKLNARNFAKMEETEKFFKCPYCLEKISMLLDVSVSGVQSYIEDCEVCCNPIQISYTCEKAKVKNFNSEKISQ